LTLPFQSIWAVQLLGGANFYRYCVIVAPFHLERSVYQTHIFILYNTKGRFQAFKM